MRRRARRTVRLLEGIEISTASGDAIAGQMNLVNISS